jgi:hypothetical protein
MTATEVNAFFDEYADAFSREDAERICKLWDYPAFMSYGGRQMVFGRDQFHHNTLVLCAFYRAQGLVRAEKQVLELMQLTATTASVRTEDRLFDAAGEPIAEWEHVYLLSETADGVKIVAALPDNELHAWRQRGTPLGSL